MAPATYLSATEFQIGDVNHLLSTWITNEDDVRSVVMDGAFVNGLWDFKGSLTGDRRIAVLDEVSAPMRAVLSEWFSGVVTSDEATFLPRDQLEATLESNDAHDRFIAGVVTDHDVILYRGSLTPVFVDRRWFGASPSSQPDFNRFRLTDHGQTVVLGDYEAATEAILYELDPGFRRRARARELEVDTSVGGAIRRLRLQKGLSRSDFAPLNPKTVARIERNEVDRPHPRTLNRIARRLGVKVAELATY